MKLNSPLNPEQTAALSACKDRLAKIMSRLDAHAKGHRGLCEKMRKLEKEHALLESDAATGSRKASLEIHALTDQRRRLERTIEIAEENAHEHKAPLYDAVNAAQEALNPVIRDIQLQIEDEVEAVLTPYWTDHSWARAVARQTDAIRSLGHFFNASVGLSAAKHHAAAVKFLTTIEAVLAGGKIWSFKK